MNFDEKFILEHASREDLELLVKYLNESFTNNVKKVELNRRQFAVKILNEIREMGGNSICNLIRRKDADGCDGPAYDEVVKDVAGRCNVKFEKKDDVETVEQKLLAHIIDEAYNKAKPEEKRKMEEALKEFEPSEDFGSLLRGGMLLSQVLVGVMGGLAFRTMGFWATLSLARNLGIKYATAQVLGRAAGVFLGPIGWAATLLLTLTDLAGPAYRVTIPCVVHIAYLRQCFKSISENAEKEKLDRKKDSLNFVRLDEIYDDLTIVTLN